MVSVLPRGIQTTMRPRLLCLPLEESGMVIPGQRLLLIMLGFGLNRQAVIPEKR